MTSKPDPYWDELGIAWCAIDPKVEVIVPRIRARLRRQSLLIWTGLIIGLPIGIAGIMLGGYTIAAGSWMGAWNFVTRGIAIELISALILYAWFLLLPVRSAPVTRPLSEMLGLAITRAEATLTAIRLGCYSCIVAALFGVIGVAIRTYFGDPPQMSPIVACSIIAVLAAGLFLYGRETKVALAKFRHLRRALATEAA
jgi:hypothetical protein